MGKSTLNSKIIYSRQVEHELLKWIEKYSQRKIFLATEETVDKLWISKFESFLQTNNINKVVIPAGENNKKVESVVKIWDYLSTNGGDRKSLLINSGGGMLTDLAGFAATTFKRGIDFLNVPTTLLSQVDASVGGKTGINFGGYKNEIGTFKEPIAVLINTDFLSTIDDENFISGFAEMIKHGLIYSRKHLEDLEKFDIVNINYNQLQNIIRDSVNVKSYFVSNDPTEQNIRKALNFGHTIGHAFESYAMKQNKPIQHGHAVAYGMIAELYLSVKMCNFPKDDFNRLTKWLLQLYNKFGISGDDFEALFELMTHDKKNESGRINFTLLSEIGKIEINQNCNKELIFESLNYFANL